MRNIRRNLPGVVYHLIWRCVDHRWYLDAAGARETYLRLLGRALAASDWLCLAYALMSNHVHLSILAGQTSLASWSTRAHTPFASWVNDDIDRIGPVFARGPKDYAIIPAKEASLLAYIHRNPERAGVVVLALESDWTSHRAYLGLEPAPPWLHIETALARTGMTRETFAAWVDEEAGESGVVATDRIAAAARRQGALRVATPSTREAPLVARPFGHVRVSPRRVIELAAEISGVDSLVVCSRRRVADALMTRRAVVHASRAMGLSDSDIAAALGISQQGVSKIGGRVLSSAERGMCVMICERLRFEVSSESRG